MNKYKIIALFGESGSGKDTIKKSILKNNNHFNNIISYTTRPKRNNEVNGVDYNFVDREYFAKNLQDMLEVTSFNNWFYGTNITSLKKDKVNIGIFNIYAIDCLLMDPQLSVLPLYIKCEDKIRLIRCLNREKNVDCNEICRRFLADKKDFLDIPFSYIVYNNSFDNNDNYFDLLNLSEIVQFIKYI